MMRPLTFAWILLTGLTVNAQNGEYVDPTIGNVGALLQPTRPTVQLPHQMIRVYPNRKDYIDDRITDFPLIVVSHRLGQAFSVRPSRGGSGDEPMPYDQGSEITRPWYYATYLLDDDVAVDFTPGRKTGIYRFAFSGQRPRNVLFGTYNKGESAWHFDGDQTLHGMETYHDNIKVYVYGRFSEKGRIGASGSRAWANFGANGPTDTVEFRYAVSYISPEQARRSFEEELSGRTFAALKQDAFTAWSAVLGQIRVEGGTEAEKRSFYTALYRCNERMVDITEDGQYYSGFDNTIHRTSGRPFYVDDWIWDTYLALHPLRAILDTGLERDMLNSYVTMYKQLGWMPTFPVLFGDHACMNGFHSSIMILDDYRKGIRPDDPSAAYEGMRKNATSATLLPWRNGPSTSLDSFFYTHGYMPALRPGETETVAAVNPGEHRQAVAVTLGASYDDWAVAQMASELGHTRDYTIFMDRSSNYKRLWDTSRGMFLPRDSSGAWIGIDPKFDGGAGGRDYYDENNGWTYLWQVQEDIGGLVRLMGGPASFEARLDQLFREGLGRSKSDFWYKFPDATGNVGQYSMGNEPSFHIPYLYNFTSSPWKTAERVRLLLDLWFRDNVFGIPGDEDGGGMSAFVVFSSMGFYPVTPGIPVYAIGSPVFTRASISLPNGRTFTVSAPLCSRVNKYVQRATLNGVDLMSPWFTHAQLMAGGTLELVMGPRPNRDWGLGARPSVAGSRLRLPAIISDHMVLQGGTAAPVWGWAAPGAAVRVSIRGRTYSSLADSTGRWTAHLAPLKPGGPFDMSITCGADTMVLHDILVGDVWLASGQSNMEFGIQTDSHAATTIPRATDSLIRFFYVPMAKSPDPQEGIGEPVTADDGRWIVCSPAALSARWAWHGPSAVGYYFAQKVRTMTHAPVGMICSYKGGTPAQAWVSRESLFADTALRHYVALRPAIVGFGTPTVLFNAMIHPLLPYAIKGVIWYQGESNGDRLTDAMEYKTLFPALIRDWRRQWGEGDFPFLYVQLPNFQPKTEGNWPWVREAQYRTLSLAQTGMAVTIDLGEPGNIHPTDKLDVGYRLAAVAGHLVYHQRAVYTGPRYDHMAVDGRAIRVWFTEPLRPVDTLKGFAVAGPDGRFVTATARLDGDAVIVSSDQVPSPVAVRYDWADNPDGNLFNKEGLPAAPFRTDQ
ncbi:MAG TPA: GH92 family glycosyl hydrolase [Dinghuibacter sp.]|uniref:GH92 family glycosyl hydrolase n=1 Tax=Dinghuibacter sp. TaxID=2024697 RepID=UPI002C7E299D|nr:GH92 family glycosyl hydrolase [Dinghuibacter sp.]HTJ11778.1 GH92 family glycosyl hydrolase [Dinghuibacter sp.]